MPYSVLPAALRRRRLPNDQFGLQFDMLRRKVRVLDSVNQKFRGGVAKLVFWGVDRGDLGRRYDRVIHVVVADDHKILRDAEP